MRTRSRALAPRPLASAGGGGSNMGSKPAWLPARWRNGTPAGPPGTAAMPGASALKTEDAAPSCTPHGAA